MEYNTDYYAVLELKRDATDTQIKQAYRKFALKSHPLKNQNDAEAAKRFRLVAEAYDVLADPQRRAIFDQYGERGLKEGTPNGRGGVAGGWSFSGNPEELFAEHFGSSSPFAEFFASEGNQLFKSYQQTEVKKVPAQEINLYVSLEELYSGARKVQKVVRKRLGMDGRTLSLEEKLLTVEVGAGWREGTRITFPKEGDEQPGLTEPGDVVLVLREKPHPRFVRRGNDLVYTAKLSLLQALTGCVLPVETLDRRVLSVGVNEVAAPGSRKVVSGEGMPHPKTGVKGNLVLEFEVVFPQQLTQSQKQAIKDILAPSPSQA